MSGHNLFEFDFYGFGILSSIEELVEQNLLCRSRKSGSGLRTFFKNLHFKFPLRTPVFENYSTSFLSWLKISKSKKNNFYVFCIKILSRGCICIVCIAYYTYPAKICK